jgi:hypothetical protein
MNYRAVASYMGGEISEGFGRTQMEAIMDARSQIGQMYHGLHIVYEIHREKV